MRGCGTSFLLKSLGDRAGAPGRRFRSALASLLDITLIRSLKKAGVDFRVCGQAVMAKKVDPKAIQPEIELDLWALTTLVNLELRGYVHVGN